MSRAFIDYFRCPEDLVTFAVRELPSSESGYFQFGSDAVCFGRCSSHLAAKHVPGSLHDAMEKVIVDGRTVWLPFDPSEIAANLRFERHYTSNGNGVHLGAKPILRKAYYTVRPLLPVSVRKHLQRMHLRDWTEIRFPNWPVDSNVESMFEELMALLLESRAGENIPFIWFWPDGLPSCAIMTHDVEGLLGRDLCSRLMDVDDAYGIKSSFEVVPERKYAVPESLLGEIRDRGFEINVHDLDHDGRLFSDRNLFLQRVERINRYGKEYDAIGFRSAVLYRNVDWFDALDFAYDMSVPSVGNLEAQRGGCCSISPFFIGKILELPATTVQDYCLFHLLNQDSIDLWRRQTALIGERHGLATFIVHPDYVFEGRILDRYRELLDHLADLRSEDKIWIARPREVNQWWRDRSQMTLTRRSDGWEIEGPGKERARIAYASLEGNQLVYRIGAPSLSTAKTVNAA